VPNGANLRVRLKAGLPTSPRTLNPRVCSPSFRRILHSRPKKPSQRSPKLAPFGPEPGDGRKTEESLMSGRTGREIGDVGVGGRWY